MTSKINNIFPLPSFFIKSLLITSMSLVMSLMTLSLSAQNDSIPENNESNLPLPDSLMQKTSDSSVYIAPFPTKADSSDVDTTQRQALIDSTQVDSTASNTAALSTDTEKKPKINKDSIEYAANSVWMVYESDLYLNTKIEVHPDTSVYNFHRYNIIQQNDYTYQDLGNLGTAAQSIFYQPPEQLGNRWGINVYEPYILRPDEIPYLNTLAPYVDVYLVQGGQGKSWLDATVSRNVNPDWNVAIRYRRMSSNKVINRAFRRNDEQFEHQTFMVTNRYFSRNHRYKMLAHFSYYDHNMLEIGGVRSNVDLGELDAQGRLDTLYQLDDSELDYRLPAFGKVNQFGRTFHLYHQYAIAKGGAFEIFHRASYSQNTSTYTDQGQDYTNNISFYNEINPLPVVSAQGFRYENFFSQLENKGGIKGRIKNFQYRTFAKLRTYQLRYDFPFAEGLTQANEEVELDPELFVGGGMRYFLDSASYIDATAEYELFGDYSVSAEWNAKGLRLGGGRVNYSPSLLAQYSFQPHLRWQNDNFENITLDRVYASYSFAPLPYLAVRPYVEGSNIQNLVFFDSTAIARQTSQATQSLSAGVALRGKLKYWNAELNLRYNQNLGEDLLRMPTFFGNMLVYYEKELFDNAMDAQIGADIHFHTRYQADAYNPLIQQFHLQNQWEVGGFPMMDLFFNFKVSRARIALKANNVLLDLTAQGYYDTPLYIAQPRSFEVVINWLFFN